MYWQIIFKTNIFTPMVGLIDLKDLEGTEWRLPPPVRDTGVIHDGRVVDHCLQGNFSPPGAMEAGLGCLCQGLTINGLLYGPGRSPAPLPSPLVPQPSPLQGLVWRAHSACRIPWWEMKRRQTDASLELRKSCRPGDQKGSLKPQRRSPVRRKKGGWRSWGRRKKGRRAGEKPGGGGGGWEDLIGREAAEGGPLAQGAIPVGRGSRARKQCGIFLKPQI